MSSLVLATCMIFLLVVTGCAVPGVPAASAPAAAVDTAAPVGAGDCPVTASVTWRPPDSGGRDPLPHGPYFRSPDGRIGTADRQPWSTGGMKVLWLKPVGSRLEVSGRRLDGEAPPLRADLHGPQAYPGDFGASGVHFPTVGWWEVEARADGSVLRFVVSVR